MALPERQAWKGSGKLRWIRRDRARDRCLHVVDRAGDGEYAGDVRVNLDQERDQATIFFGSVERQSYEHGWTSLVMTEPAEIQLGFEGEHRLVFMMARPASLVLPPEVLAKAGPVA
jgi:hypothetical protein